MQNHLAPKAETLGAFRYVRVGRPTRLARSATAGEMSAGVFSGGRDRWLAEDVFSVARHVAFVQSWQMA
jgi:hypothetical protein